MSKKIREYITIFLGSMIVAFALYNFHYRYHITEGGILGALLLFKYILNISPSITNIIIDYTLFAIGGKVFGKNFLIKSLFASLSFSINYAIFEKINYYLPIIHNRLIISLLAGLLIGLGVGVVICQNAAAGGDDVLALIGAKYLKCNLAKIYVITDIIVLSLSLMVYLSLQDFIYSIITVITSSLSINCIHCLNNK